MNIKSYLIKFQGIILIGLMAMPLAIAAQTAEKSSGIKPDPRLYECFSKEYVDGLQGNPKLIAYYNFYLDHSFFISEPQKKPSQGTDISQVAYKEPDAAGKVRYFNEDISKLTSQNLNVLKYDFKLSQDKYTHYLLGNSGRTLVFYPMKDISARYHEYLKSLNLE